MSLLAITGGTVVTEAGPIAADILVADGVITEITPSGAHTTALGGYDDASTAVIDATGLIVLPGGVDVHTHMDSPSGLGHTTDSHQSGTRAAAAGGTTTIVDFAPQRKGEPLPSLYERWSEKMSGQCAIDYSFHATISSWYPTITADMSSLVNDGVSSFKVYMAYKGAVMIDDRQLFEVLRASASQGSRVCIHAENGDVIDAVSQHLVDAGKTLPRYHKLARPADTEAEAVNRAIMIARLTDSAPYFVHLSTKRAVDHVQEARAEGLPIAAETCTHYLSLDDSVYDSDDFDVAKYVLTPPLRTREDQDRLWTALNDGDLSVVSSDHCPLCLVGQKDLGRHDFRDIPNGGPGVENRVLVTYSEGVAKGRLSLQKFAEVIATEPAKTFGLYPRKGAIRVGSDADLTLLDPNATTVVSAQTQVQNVDYNLWEGWAVRGSIHSVYSRGVLVGASGRHVGPHGHGRFIARKVRS
ncbi:dihydropyrimidinase [Microbacterium keratanolyticum]